MGLKTQRPIAAMYEGRRGVEQSAEVHSVHIHSQGIHFRVCHKARDCDGAFAINPRIHQGFRVYQLEILFVCNRKFRSFQVTTSSC